ncbi:MAG: alpha/beta fold hydrolase [Anaerolineae bacterium]
MTAKRRSSRRPTIWSLAKAAVTAHVLAQGAFVAYQLLNSDVRRTLAQPQNRAPQGVTLNETDETEHYTRIHKLEDGIEWISYLPKVRRHDTPILMQHGMWHGAWCWSTWQEALAEWGWESHAISQPGHGMSPVQRPIFACTLEYYLSFLRDAVNKLPHKPILMGHSMGGALTQYYLKYIGNLPAAVLVAPWALPAGLWPSMKAFWELDPVGFVTTSLTWRSDFVRSPSHAANALLSPTSILSPDDFYRKLGDESALVMLQHGLWTNPDPSKISTPMLWLAGEKDAVCPESAERFSADFYHADYRVYPGAAHNLMMEANHREIAAHINDWLEDRG